jgi:UDP-glucose 4-epimerase
VDNVNATTANEAHDSRHVDNELQKVPHDAKRGSRPPNDQMVFASERHHFRARTYERPIETARRWSQNEVPPAVVRQLNGHLDHRADTARASRLRREPVWEHLQDGPLYTGRAGPIPIALTDTAQIGQTATRSLDDARILVIGGAGFIGSHIVEQLLQEPAREIVVLDNLVRGKRENLASALKDPRVSLIDGSIADPKLLARLMEGTDYAFHLAALWLYECVHHPRDAIEINIVGTFNVMEAAQAAGVKKVVYSSSASVYGDALFTPMTESHPFNNRTTYGATKIAGEQLFRAWNEQHGLDYVGLRYMNVYGPRMDYQGTYVSVIMKVLDRIDQGERPAVWGDGSQAYDFVHVVDVARANILALKSGATDSFYNVGTGVKTTVNELVGKLLELSGSDLEIEYLPQEQMFVTHRIGSTDAAAAELGFRATVPLDEGLRSVMEWRRRDQQRALTARA